MRRFDNTLYVTTQGAYLCKEATNVVVRIERETRLSVPIHTIGGIVCFGNVSISPFLLGMCGREGVEVSFLTENGKFLARVQGPQSGNILLRRAQHKHTSDEKKAMIAARAVVGAKIANSRTVLQRLVRDHQESIDRIAVRGVVLRLKRLLAVLQKAETLEEVRVREAESARSYFGVFHNLIIANKKDFAFFGRTRRPPRDRTNALMSFMYTLLVHDVAAACEGVGLDPQMGFLHADRPGRQSLALDLVEELRPILADRLVLSLINRQQVMPKGFRFQESGAVIMDDKTRKTVLVAYQERKKQEFLHPFLEEKITIGLLPHIQARLMARYLRGDLNAYPALFWK